jgi:hypothetical protein
MTQTPTAQQRKQYDAGWRSGQTPTAARVEAADRRRAPAAWYIGFFDAEGGNAKYAGI